MGESTAAEVSTEAEVDEGAEEVEMVSFEVPADKEVKVTGLVESELTLTSEDLAEMEAESVAIEHPKQVGSASSASRWKRSLTWSLSNPTPKS